MDKSNNLLKDNKGHHRLREGRISFSGEVYFITICVEDNKLCLNTSPSGKIIFDSLEYFNNENKTRMVCCIVMPDHIHIVFQLGEKESLPDVIRSFKRFTGREINKLLKRKGNFYQRQYFDHRIRSEENLMNVIQYCLDNPVRKGMVDNPNDYPYWKIWEENLRYVM